MAYLCNLCCLPPLVLQMGVRRRLDNGGSGESRLNAAGRLSAAAASSYWAGTTTGPLGLLARRPHSSSGTLSLPPATSTMGLQRAGSTPSLGATAAAAANPFAPSSAAAPSSTAVASSSTSAVVGPDPAGFAASCYFDMDAVLLTALDVAQGMRHLHRNNVLHAGVCGGGRAEGGDRVSVCVGGERWSSRR